MGKRQGYCPHWPWPQWPPADSEKIKRSETAASRTTARIASQDVFSSQVRDCFANLDMLNGRRAEFRTALLPLCPDERVLASQGERHGCGEAVLHVQCHEARILIDPGRITSQASGSRRVNVEVDGRIWSEQMAAVSRTVALMTG